MGVYTVKILWLGRFLKLLRYFSACSGLMELCAGRCSVSVDYLTQRWPITKLSTISRGETDSRNQHYAQTLCELSNLKFCGLRFTNNST